MLLKDFVRVRCLLIGIVVCVIGQEGSAYMIPQIKGGLPGREHDRAQHPQRYYLERPSPSKEIFPLPKLQEPVGTKYNPRLGKMDIRLLRTKLGNEFDPKYMSIRMPKEMLTHPNGSLRYPFKTNSKGNIVTVNENDGEAKNVPKFIQKLQLALPDATMLGTRLTPKLRKKLVLFTWAITSCPVLEKWRDLGVRFWPRWLKEGQCQEERSCSIPPGMRCKPSEAQYKVILRWYCQDYDKANNCRWIQVRHPVITACKCECNKNFED